MQASARVRLVTIAAISCWGTDAFAQVFLRIDTDPRAAGMATVGTATAEGPNAAYYNPALLALELDPSVLVSLPVTQQIPQLSNTIFIRELSSVFPLSGARIPLAVGINYRRLSYGITGRLEGDEIDAVDWALGFSFAARPLAGLAAGARFQVVSVEGFDRAEPSFDLGVLGTHRLVAYDDNFVEGRVGMSVRRWGPDFRAETTIFSTVQPQDTDLAWGTGLILGSRRTRLTLGVDLVDPVGDSANFVNREFEQFYGAELEVLTLAARVGHAEISGNEHPHLGFGLAFPFPAGLLGRFDYAREPTALGAHDRFGMSLRWAPDARELLEDTGRIRTRFAVGVVDPADAPGNEAWDIGPSLRVASQLELTRDTDLETWFAWGWVQDQDDNAAESNFTFVQFGGGVRQAFDFGRAARPYACAGFGGYRIGESHTETTDDGREFTERGQVVAPGYTLGVGYEFDIPESPGRSIDVALLVHNFRPQFLRHPETWWELNVGFTLP